MIVKARNYSFRLPELKGILQYKYPHDYPDHYVEEEYLPENLIGRTYYHPTELDLEKEIRKRLDDWRGKKNEEK